MCVGHIGCTAQFKSCNKCSDKLINFKRTNASRSFQCQCWRWSHQLWFVVLGHHDSTVFIDIVVAQMLSLVTTTVLSSLTSHDGDLFRLSLSECSTNRLWLDRLCFFLWTCHGIWNVLTTVAVRISIQLMYPWEWHELLRPSLFLMLRSWATTWSLWRHRPSESLLSPWFSSTRCW